VSGTGILWRRVELFDNYSYGFCPDEKCWNKFWRVVDKGEVYKPFYPGRSDARTTFTNPDETKVFHPVAIVTMNNDLDKDPVQVAALLVHEAVHIKQAILRYFGEDNIGDETEAYLVQRISQDLMNMYRDTRVK
jgi:hypothetical protein